MKRRTKSNSHFIHINNNLTFLEDYFIMYYHEKIHIINCKYIKTIVGEKKEERIHIIIVIIIKNKEYITAGKYFLSCYRTY